MTKLAEIIAAVTATNAGVTEARAHAGETLTAAEDLTNVAAEHGWDGVAATMQEAVEALERAIQQLDVTAVSSESAVAHLEEIAKQATSPDVTERLAAALAELENGATALESAGSEIDEATEATQRTGEPEELLKNLLALRETTDQLHGQVRETTEATDAEREEAMVFGNS